MQIKGLIVQNCTVGKLMSFLEKYDKNCIVQGTLDSDFRVILAVDGGAYIIWDEEITDPEFW